LHPLSSDRPRPPPAPPPFPTRRSSDLFPDAAQANHAIFYVDGKPATVGEVYANLTRVGGAGEAVARAQAAGDDGFIQYASARRADRKSTRLNSSHSQISYAVFCLKKKK